MMLLKPVPPLFLQFRQIHQLNVTIASACSTSELTDTLLYYLAVCTLQSSPLHLSNNMQSQGNVYFGFGAGESSDQSRRLILD